MAQCAILHSNTVLALKLDFETINYLTIAAAFSQSIILLITVFVLYKNLLTLKKQNEHTIKKFQFQSNVEKYNLTLKFADWVKSELSDYINYFLGTEKHAHLTQEEIKEHYDNIAVNMIKLINDDVVFKSLLTDEIKKMIGTLSSVDKDDQIIPKLKDLLD